MKILYAAQGTGNGHLSRAREIVPYLQQYGEVDILVSGTQADVKLPFPIQYQHYGTSFMFGKKGGIDFWKTLQKTKILRLTKDIWNCPVKDYDIVFNDFEPVGAWACKLQGLPCVGLSHQGAFLSDKTPRPKRKKLLPELLLKNFAPTSIMYAFHFDRYDDFIYTPVIRQEIRQATIKNQGHIAVYLPAVADERLVSHFSKVNSVEWKIFSKRVKAPHYEGNVSIFPVDNDAWIEAASSAEGVLMGAGFEGPAETLFMGKKLMVMPMIGQYEQQCNAAALEVLGVPVFHRIRPNFHEILEDWLKNINPIQVNYPDETADIIRKIFDNL